MDLFFDGAKFSLKIVSTAPKKYNLDWVELGTKDVAKRAYHQKVQSPTGKDFMQNVATFMEKFCKQCDDCNLVSDVSKFFTFIAK